MECAYCNEFTANLTLCLANQKFWKAYPSFFVQFKLILAYESANLIVLFNSTLLCSVT